MFVIKPLKEYVGMRNVYKSFNMLLFAKFSKEARKWEVWCHFKENSL